ncbi:MAG: hypothetical protein HeimC3_37500 [Candidatus Heimdallarchaeota archaeon LC_3]|nr:MAG: hypothetical protein HeimC3_37500 [Candidatus Heimdallarchaeota archaeon LC_3]
MRKLLQSIHCYHCNKIFEIKNVSNDLSRMRLCSTDCYYNIMSVSFSLGIIMLIMSIIMPVMGYFIGYTMIESYKLYSIVKLSPEIGGITLLVVFSIISIIFLFILIQDVKTKRVITQVKKYNKKNRTITKKMILDLPKTTQKYLK